ncbi:hypothetical protein SAMN05421830_105166 [Desulfomicrobium norvegicum]|uniref:Uncharacterized protein n=1 Tax=Desulfomicrobium norvegicum (strain DSM 1741 / NCIMB 8310) TaxID=52561 RepID=A0A8G2C2W7_DESNO|nr:DUF4297 family anti-phage-associated protein [Desulfomicrobium norvegicum]SFL72434.1 hypothetical protein SAMN05421830_105166 [Desulfomicrobium norvegicum]
MTDRSAVDTIRGYFYQFDHSILRVLQLSDPGASIAVECIEDVDIYTATEITAVQCKYYFATEYNHSVIKPAVRYMLSHFKAIRDEGKQVVRYSLCGHFNAGQHKLTLPIDVAFLKQHFLTFSERKVERRHHDELGLRDADLAEFLSVLDVDINAASFENQFAQVIRELQTAYGCTPFTAEYFYYNNALALMRELSIQPLPANRTITKRAFLERSDTSSVLFNEWFVRKKGEKAHFAALRKEYFTGLNLSPFERFFLVEVDPTTLVRSDLKDVLHLLSKKWSKTTKRDGKSSFCPYVYVHGLPADELVGLKKELATEGFGFIDGYDFHGADFNVKSIAKPATHDNGIKLKVLNSIVDLEATVGAVTKTREVYQFHLGKSYFEPANKAVKHVQIQLQKLTNIKAII